MFSSGERLKRIKAIEQGDRADLAAARTAEAGATVPGGHPTQMGGPPTPTISRPEDAQAFVDARTAEGSDYIKIIHDDGSTWPCTNKRVPMLDNATLRALIQAAHKRGKLAVVHILSEQQARDAIEAGADGLAHIFLGESAGTGFGELAASHHVFVVATLSTLYLDCGKSEGPALVADPHLHPYIHEEWRAPMDIPKMDATKNHFCKGTEEGIRQLIDAHVPILAGTDAPTRAPVMGLPCTEKFCFLYATG